MKKMLCALLAAMMLLGALAGCSNNNGSTPDDSKGANDAAAAPGDDTSKTGGAAPSDTSDLGGELVFAIWDNNLMEYIEANDMEAKFQEKYPNATIEVEKIKDDSEYWNSMKMRASANQLPDVMFNKPFTLS